VGSRRTTAGGEKYIDEQEGNMPSHSAKGFADKTPLDFECQYAGCTRKIKTTIGALRRSPSLRCSAGHTTHVDGKRFDKDFRDFEKGIES
jgi:hypothetical protein